MLFAGPLAADPVIGPVIVSMPTGPKSTKACPDALMVTQRAQLFSAVTQGIFKVQQALENGYPVDKNLAMTLADQSRRLGKIEGQIDACTPSSYTAAQIRSLHHQNARDLLSSEVKLNEMWMTGNYKGWLTMRTKIQLYHREVTKWAHLLSKAAASVTPLPLNPIVAVSEGGANTAVLPGMSTSPVVDPVFVAPDPEDKPFYKRGAFWGVVGGLLAIGTGIVIVTR